MKTCTKCGQTKDISCFGKNRRTKDGIHWLCKECAKKASGAYYAAHAEKCKAHQKAYYAAHTNQCQAKSLEIYHRNAQDDEFRVARNARQRVFAKEYMKRPKTKRLAAGWTRRYLEKTEARISRRVSFQVWYSLRKVLDKANGKNGRHWEDLVGWTVEQLMAHLESKFQDGMTWETYGGDAGWQIDHVTPRSWFKIRAVGDEAFRKCWELDNLQPKWLTENASKGNRFAG